MSECARDAGSLEVEISGKHWDIDRLIVGRVVAFAHRPRDALHGPDLLQKLQRIERARCGD
jgi:hypothetical protein